METGGSSGDCHVYSSLYYCNFIVFRKFLAHRMFSNKNKSSSLVLPLKGGSPANRWYTDAYMFLILMSSIDLWNQLFVWLASHCPSVCLMLNVGHYMQTFQPKLVTDAMLIGTILLHFQWPWLWLRVTRWVENQTWWLHLLVHFSTGNLRQCWSSSTWTS